MGDRGNVEHGDVGVQPDEFIAAGPAQKKRGETRFSIRSTHITDAALQALCQGGLHHDTKPKTNLESGDCDAAKNMDAGLVGWCESVRFAS